MRESPDVYYEIQALNPNSASALGRLADAISRVSSAVSSGDAQAFRSLMDDGRSRTGG
jgi:prephenate dehydrogenase